MTCYNFTKALYFLPKALHGLIQVHYIINYAPSRQAKCMSDEISEMI